MELFEEIFNVARYETDRIENENTGSHCMYSSLFLKKD